MYWNWKMSGVALGLCFFLTVLVIKPIGVSTQFVIFDGIAVSLFKDDISYKDESTKTGYASSNAYLNKSGGKYAKAVSNPINYSFIFVVAMFLGGFVARKLQGMNDSCSMVPDVHKRRFGDSRGMRVLLAFIGGVLVLWGARLAGGCTSGHMMSGMMQTSISGYLFAVAAFIAAVPTAILLYKK